MKSLLLVALLVVSSAVFADPCPAKSDPRCTQTGQRCGVTGLCTMSAGKCACIVPGGPTDPGIHIDALYEEAPEALQSFCEDWMNYQERR